MMIFNEKYHSDDFLQFLQDFLPEDFVEKEKDIILEKDKFKKITKAKELGFCESLDLYILEIDHNSETDPRMAIASEAFKILAQYWMHKALVIFKNKDCDNYRLSYLTISLDLNEENKTVEKYSNARRYSFYLGPGAKTKTPELQLIKKGRIKDAVDLVGRFSLEVVNKQFYLEVAKYFDELVSDEAHNLVLPSQVDANTRKSFAVRLIGRIMFCWFLKQKKSGSGQLVPDELLSSRVARDNYYHNMLERLFFEVLNTNIDDRGIRNEFYDKVPYLNGGLFSPQSEDYYELDRSIGASRYINTLKIKDEWFKNFFELLETYNFTIDENTVFDQELSVDPEMLGRIFENLLAEINPETGSSERKRTGSFYTPRQIVEYMVDQSLIEYLKTKTGIDKERLSALVSYDEDDDPKHPLNDNDKQNIVAAIESLRILDPACGSGAFPVGALQKIVYILQIIDPDGMLWRNKKLESVPELYRKKIEEEFSSQTLDYIRKLEVIKNSIFGIDIQPIAVEVSRLRCFLTLVVESVIDDAKKNRGVQALPNLDFKFVCANTLIPAPEQEAGAGDRLFSDDFQEKLASAVDRYFSSSGVNKITASNEIHKLIDRKVQEKFKHLDNLVSCVGDKKMEGVRAKTNKKQIDKQSRILSLWNSYKNIFDNKPVGFFETKYFFPSVKDGFDIVIGNPPYGVSLKGQNREIVVKALGKVPDYEIYYYFIEIAKKLLTKNGINSYILPNTFLFNVFASDYRKNILDNWHVDIIIDCTAFKLFEAATVYNVIIVFSKSKDAKLVGYKNTLGAENFDDLLRKETIYIPKDELFSNNTNWGLVFKLSPIVLNIISKIKLSGQKVSDIFPEISQGLIAYDKHTGQDQEIIKNRSLHHLKKINEFVKKWLWGEDVRPYAVEWNGKEFVEYGPKIANPRLPKYFKGNRILIREITNPKIYAAFADREMYHDPAIIVVLDNCKNTLLLLGILNSKLATFYHFNASPKATKGAFPKILIKDIRLTKPII